MVDLSRLANDLMICSTPEFGYFRIPKELCTGSSMMPQKRNPCGLELVRAKAAQSLCALGPAAAPAAPALREALKDNDAEVRRCATVALSRIK